MHLPTWWQRLYGITPDRPDTAQLLIEVEACLLGGLRCLQYRDKISNATTRRIRAQALKERCSAYGALLIINDDYQLCQSIDAHGVHLGQTDGVPQHVRHLLGPDKIIGVSCHNSAELAKQAEPWVDYLAFGAVFLSMSKPTTLQTSLSVFKTVKLLGKPTVAIGGITPENCHTVLQSGADAVAVISALFNVPDIRRHTANWLNLLKRIDS